MPCLLYDRDGRAALSQWSFTKFAHSSRPKQIAMLEILSIDDDALRLLISFAPTSSLPAVACVSRAWRDAADEGVWRSVELRRLRGRAASIIRATALLPVLEELEGIDPALGNELMMRIQSLHVLRRTARRMKSCDAITGRLVQLLVEFETKAVQMERVLREVNWAALDAAAEQMSSPDVMEDLTACRAVVSLELHPLYASLLVPAIRAALQPLADVSRDDAAAALPGAFMFLDDETESTLGLLDEDDASSHVTHEERRALRVALRIACVFERYCPLLLAHAELLVRTQRQLRHASRPGDVHGAQLLNAASLPRWHWILRDMTRLLAMLSEPTANAMDRRNRAVQAVLRRATDAEQLAKGTYMRLNALVADPSALRLTAPAPAASLYVTRSFPAFAASLSVSLATAIRPFVARWWGSYA